MARERTRKKQGSLWFLEDLSEPISRGGVHTGLSSV